MDNKAAFARATTKARRLLMYTGVNVRRLIRSTRNVSNCDEAGTFRKNGFVKFRSAHALALADIFADGVKNPEVLLKSDPDSFAELSRGASGITSVAVSLGAPFLFDHVFDRKLYGLLSEYYGGQFYLRNNPTIEFSYAGGINDAQKFHLDWGLRQVSVMINLNDLGPGATHMAYILGSNRQYFFQQKSRDSIAEQRNVRRWESRAAVADTLGPVGTTSVFDAGCGYHRQVSGGFRAILHMNFVDNFAYTDWRQDWAPKGRDALAGDTVHPYWFATPTRELLARIEQSDFDADVFSLVLRSRKPAPLTPSVYSANYILP